MSTYDDEIHYVLVIDGDGKLSFSTYHERDLQMVKRFRDFLVRTIGQRGFVITLCNLRDGGEI